jgi:16S rRNA (uracil1498-N3)-methyltransferase
MHARFYAPGLVAAGGVVELPADEAAHLSRVLRLRVGASIQVFDGRGREYRGQVEMVGRARVRVAVGEELPPAVEPSVSLVLAQAVPKADAMDQVVRDAVMLGVAEIVPVLADRAEVDVRRLLASGRVARWQRIAVASVKQCGRAVVPAVREPQTLQVCLARTAAIHRYLLAEPGLLTPAPIGVRSLSSEPAPDSAILFVGPEGGWTDDEVRLALGTGGQPLTLGPRTLRADAAAIVGITALQCVWGDLEPPAARPSSRLP